MVTPQVLLLTVQIVKIETSKGDPTWFTAVVAITAALLGAGVGGFASYWANTKFDEQRREGRAAIRRKAKVYTPLRGELISVRDAMASDKHLMWGITRRPSKLDGFDREPYLYRWSQLVEDGRALTAASPRVRSSLNEVEASADTFDLARSRAQALLAREGDRIYEDVVGQEQTMHGWADHEDFVWLIRDQLDRLSIFGFQQPERDALAQPMVVFAARFRADGTVRVARQDVLDAEAALGAAIDNAIEQLDAAMSAIAKRYERESADE